MTHLYENPGLRRRMTLSTVVLVIIALYGLWELWAAARAPADQATTGYLFGAAFVAGAVYGLRQITAESRDLVTTFDVDPATGNAVATLWRPLGSQRLTADRDRLTNWRLHVRIGKRNARTTYLYVDQPDHPRPLQFELRQGMTITDDLRRLAPEAIDEFEQASASNQD